MTDFTKPPPFWTEISDPQIDALAEFLQRRHSTLSREELHCVSHWMSEVSAVLSFSSVAHRPVADRYAAALVRVVTCGEIAFAGEAARSLLRMDRHRDVVFRWVVRCFDEPSAALAERPWRWPAYGGALVDSLDAEAERALIGELHGPAAFAADELIQGGLLSESELAALRAAAERAGFGDDGWGDDRNEVVGLNRLAPARAASDPNTNR